MLMGSIVNAFAVLIGSAAGLLLAWLAKRFSARFPAISKSNLGERLPTVIMQGLAFCTMYIGISGALKGQNTLVAIISIALGALIGELLDLDHHIHRLGDWIQTKMSVLTSGSSTSVSEGFVTASLLFCVGAMAIVGALDSGLRGNHDTLYAKSLLDGISSIVFSASLGFGVALSAAAVLLYQGGITLLASFLQPLLNDYVIGEMGCVGSLLIMMISLNMLKVTNIKVMNYLPAIFLPILLCTFM